MKTLEVVGISVFTSLRNNYYPITSSLCNKSAQACFVRIKVAVVGSKESTNEKNLIE